MAKPFHTIAARIILTTLVLFLVFSSAFMALLVGSVRRGFENIEATVLDEDRKRCVNAIGFQFSTLELFCQEYAVQEETYDFLGARDSRYALRTFSGAWTRRLAIGLVAVLDANCAVLWTNGRHAGAAESAESEEARMPRIAEIAREVAAKRDGRGRGIVDTPRGPLFFVMAPIRPAGWDRPNKGFLLFGKYLDAAQVEALGAGTQTSVALLSRNSPYSPAVYHGNEAAPALVRTNGLILMPFAYETAFGDDIHLEVVRSRTLWNIGERMLGAVGLAFMLLNVGICAVLIFLTRRIVVSPLRLICLKLERIVETEDFSTRLAPLGRNELGKLVSDINTLLTRIDTRTGELKRLNAELETIANTDRLTGLATRRMFEKHMDKELRRMKREMRGNAQKNVMSILLCDVDFFKRYNDTYGHPAGDACLTAIGSAIAGSIHRAGDLACRFGGEEFLVVLPDCGGAGEAIVAQAIIQGVRDLEIPHSASETAPIVTISVGGACREVTQDFRIEDLIEEADGALYQAKREGRNCYRSVCSAAACEDRT